MICLFHRNEKKRCSGNGLKIIYSIQPWPSDVKKVENRFSHTLLKLLTNLTNWKTEYLIAQLSTGFQQKKFWLKVYFKPSRKNPDFFLPLPSELIWLKICLLRDLTTGLVFKKSVPASLWYRWDHFSCGDWNDFYSVCQQYPMILFQPMCNT